MPLILILRFVFGIVSLAVLGAAGYLLWEWYDGELVRQADGDVLRIRTDWMLYAGAGLLAFSFLGRPIVAPLLARPDTDPTSALQAQGSTVPGVNGTQLHVELLGSPKSPPIILIHGWAMDSTIWFYAKRDLARNFRVIAWDLPGMGRSKAGSAAEISLEAFANNLRVVIGLSGEKVLLVGHSIGGMTIQTLARDHAAFFNDHVAGTVLVNTTHTNPLRTMVLSSFARAIRWPLLEPVMRLGILLQPLVWLGAWQSYLSGSAHIANRLGFGKFVTRSQLEQVTLLSTRNSPGHINRGNLAMFRWDATGAMAATSPPLLVLSGAADIVTKPEAGRDISTHHHDSEYVEVDGVNHMGFLELPEAYNAAIADFAAKAFAKERQTPSSIVL